MPWNTDIDWTDLNSMVNVPLWVLLEDLSNATIERLKPLGGTALTPYKPGTNTPFTIETVSGIDLDYLRDAMVACVNGFRGTTEFRIRYLKPVSGYYDWTNESDLSRWDMTALVAELGNEPEHGFNAPITADWAKWWYDALNLLVYCEYGEVYGRFRDSQRSSRSGTDSTFLDAKIAYGADSWGSWSNTGGFSPLQYSRESGGTYRVGRSRYRTRDTTYFAFTPRNYTANYTVTAWAKFTAIDAYDNTDYPCNLDTYAEVWNDTDVQSGDYDKDITVNDIGTITATEPSIDEEVGWNVNSISRLCRFDIAGGFDYVAP